MTPEIEGYRIGALVQEDALFQRFEAIERGPDGRERPVRATVVFTREGEDPPADFERDADAARALGDRGFAALLAAGRTADGHLYVVQPAEPTVTLAELVADGPLSPELAARIAADVARELAAAHAMDPPLVHFSLRPLSVRIGPDGFTRLDDFAIGRAGMLAASGKTTVLQATSAYMAPEQVDPRGAPGPAADLFALASVLYEAVTGSSAFEAGTGLATTLKVSMAKAPPLDGMPDELAAVLTRLWSKDPSKRGDAARAAQELAQVAGREADARRTLGDRVGGPKPDAPEPPPLRFDPFDDGDGDKTDMQIELPNYVPAHVTLPLPDETQHAAFDDMEHEATALDATASLGADGPSPGGGVSMPLTVEIPNPAARESEWVDSTMPLQDVARPDDAARSTQPMAPPRGLLPKAPAASPSVPARLAGTVPLPPALPDPKPPPSPPRGVPPMVLWVALGTGAILIVALTALTAIWLAS